MENLLIQPNTEYATRSGEIVYIDKRIGPHFIGWVHEVYDDAKEWLEDGRNVGGDTDLDLLKENHKNQTPEIKISVRDQHEYDVWKNMLCESIESRDPKLWFAVHRWAYIMERKIEQGKSVVDIADESAKEVMGLLKKPQFRDGEFAITILYQCWKYGEALREIEPYQIHCTSI